MRAKLLPVESLVLLSSICVATAAQVDQLTRSDPEVTQALQEIVRQHKLPGGVVAGIVADGECIAVGAVGERKQGSDVAMTVDDKLHLGSCTKAMTATVAATLVEAEKLRWNATLQELLPNLEMHEDIQGATLRQLLAHRAGLPRNASGMIGPDWQSMLATDSTSNRERRQQIAARELRKPPKYPPGEKYLYSNLGYVIAGHILEEIEDASFRDIMRRRLFEPLNMDSAGFGPPSSDGNTDQPWGHVSVPLLGWQALQRDNPSPIDPAGRVHCTLQDWAKFAALHLKHGPGESPLLTTSTIDALHTPERGEHYVGGWIVADRKWAGGTALTHAGSNTMWHAIIWLAPEREAAFLVVANAGGTFAACDEAIGKLIEIFERRQ